VHRGPRCSRDHALPVAFLRQRFFKVAIPFKRGFLLALGSPTGKWANSEVLPFGGDSARRLPPYRANTRCGPERGTRILEHLQSNSLPTISARSIQQ
jgi:hypothetical protein